jgi:hypothetical protein
MTIQALLPLPVAFPSIITTNLFLHNRASPRYGAMPVANPHEKIRQPANRYLTPREEKALLECVLRMDQRGYPLPVKFLGSIPSAGNVYNWFLGVCKLKTFN